ncbi:autotransporter outer membrane beta-barrel domain-containing protein [Rhizobium sp. RU36D]|uniref:autotransporter family protein n=1 Tax=Rhizobium sp. RU36D TaxID=1907415 RepID=UPI0009D81566|nr:autotransporter outer membrane beta-barrel domain-containing protein [Rhizobium sp. RU36D]SMD00126.1 outer membrane autotransporter barrel domain-containing protein [Rhizobium sp. RU36D]
MLAIALAMASPALAGKWDGLLSNSHWYVPVPGLLGYAAPRGNFSNPVPLGDQTLWSLGVATGGTFSGSSEATLQLGPVLLSDRSTINGRVDDNGTILMIFTPDTGGQTTVGLGQMRVIGGTTAMEMQMITGTQLMVTHWASMLPYDPARFNPPPAQTIPITLASGQWSWTSGTPWRVRSASLFGGTGAGRLAISGFTNGYFWGVASGPGGTRPITVLGSITPGGKVLLATTDGRNVSTLYGGISGDQTNGVMDLETYNYVTGAFSGQGSIFTVVAPFDRTVAERGRPEAIGAAQTLYALSASELSFNPAIAPAFDLLTSVDGQVLADYIAQTLPALSGSAAAISYEPQQNFSGRLRDRLLDATKPFDIAAWVEPYGTFADQASGHQPGYHWDSQGVATGFEGWVSDRLLLGLGFNAGSLSARGDHQDRLAVESQHLGLYGSYDLERTGRVDFVLDGGLTQNSVSRSLSFAGLSTGGVYAGQSYHAGLGWSRDIAMTPDLTLTPRLSVDYGHAHTDDYAEQGGNGLGLVVEDQVFDTLRFGADLDSRMALGNGLEMSGRFGARYDAINDSRTVSARYAMSDIRFDTSSGSASPWLFTAGLGLYGKLSERTSVGVNYNLEASPAGYVEQTAELRLRISF